MIGMFPLAVSSKWQSLAQKTGSAPKKLGASTDACIADGVVLREYPHATTATTTIRTPSPDGQSDTSQSRLPVFLPSGRASCVSGFARNESRPQAFKSRKSKKGSTRCLSRRSRWHWSPVQGFRPVATRSESKPSVALPSVRAPLSLQMTISPKVQPSARQVTWRTVNFIQPTATDVRRTCANSLTKAARIAYPRGFFVRSTTQNQTEELPKRDCPCSTRY